jgi:predicted transcriptional regulator
MSLIHFRFNDNYAELLSAGLDKGSAKIIAAKLRMRVILAIAVSDKGIHIDLYDTADHAEKNYVFAFAA